MAAECMVRDGVLLPMQLVEVKHSAIPRQNAIYGAMAESMLRGDALTCKDSVASICPTYFPHHDIGTLVTNG
jgi:hypothetical protein